MCGIVGIVDRDAGDLEPVTIAMRDRLAHRGPDGSGLRVWADHGVSLGHRRLAIIDLSAAGANPMSNEDGTVWVVFNGEICNFRTLRRELERLGHVFRSVSDTEVIVHAYEQWGDAHVQRLRGFFAYALYDRRSPAGRRDAAASHRVVLVRDRLGVKPLCYHLNDRQLVFGSEIKAVLAHPDVDRAVDRSALFDYFTYSCIPAPKTAYRGIRKLLPGHMLTMENGTCAIAQYWDVPTGRSSARHDEGEVVEEVRRSIADAVDAYMTSDVPIGSLLSGGIDSSYVTALMAAAAPGLETFSMGFDTPGRDERPFAAMVAERFGTRHHAVQIDGTLVPDLPARMLDIYDEPYADGSAVPTWRLAAAASQHVKVVLSGDGGDEVFGGYNRYAGWLSAHAPPAAPRSLRGVARSVISRLSGSDRARDSFLAYARLLELFSPEEKRARLSLEWAREFDGYDDYWNYRQHWRMDLEPATRLQYLDLKTYLPDDILTKVDRAAMAHSLEVRPPLLDHQLVETVLTLPAGVRNPQGQAKFLLKRAGQGLLPDAILNRRKQGFSAPWTAWITAHQAWAAHALGAAPSGMFRDNLAANPGLSRYGEKVWAALIAEQWMRLTL